MFFWHFVKSNFFLLDPSISQALQGFEVIRQIENCPSNRLAFAYELYATNIKTITKVGPQASNI